MKKNRLKWGIIFLASIIPFLVALLLTASPKSYRATKGPSTDIIETEGVFKPGGYINFTLSPGIESLKGYHKGTVNVYPLYPDDMNQDNLMWSKTGFIPFGRDWGSSMSGSDKSMKTFKVKHKIVIPNEEHLAGQEVAFYISYSIIYPVYAVYHLV